MRGARRHAPGAWRVGVGAWLLAVGLALAAGRAGPLCADASPVAGAPVEGPPMTAMAAGELGRSTHVVLGTVRRLRDVRGLVIAHVEVERWLRGRGLPGEITVLVAGPRPGRDPRAPSVPYFDRKAGVTYVLFLTRPAQGEAFELENRQEIGGLEGAERLRAIEMQIELAQIRGADERARRVLAHFLDALEARGIWTRTHAARELNYLCGVRPEVFDTSARLRIARASESASAPTMRSWLKALEKQLDAHPDVGGPTSATAPPPSPRPTAPVPAPGSVPEPEALDAEGMLARLDATLSEAGAEAPARAERLLRRLTVPAQRAAVVDWLTAAGHAAALPMLREQYAREEELVVRQAIVRAHGLLGGAAEVPWVVERLRNLPLQETALLALARLRTPLARGVLEAFADARRQGNEEERALAEKVDHLLSPAFEAAARADAAPAPREPAR